MSDILGAAVAKGFSTLIAKFAAAVGEKAGAEIKESIRRALIDFKPYLSSTFDKCTLIKTILSKHEPINLLDCYVGLKFKSGPNLVDDFDLIEIIRKKRRVVITGTGGGGKTIFLRYLWISFFESPGDRIPIFIELRRINEITVEDLRLYIYHTISGAGTQFTIEDFNRFLHFGKFTFILDGFDEVSKLKKRLVERHILELSRVCGDCIIVVSGRPDDRFDSWQAFTNFSVCHLDESQVINLVNKLPYDRGTKKRFVERLKKDEIFKKHSSFLSNPLLVTMMLLTFKDYADIPEKVHLFYAQAFDALYQMHDASKEEFKRELYADLPSDLFKKYFSYFCLFSYFDEKYEFSKEELDKYINLAIAAQGGRLVVDDFIRDAIESVCLLQVDGLLYTFTHRSFQEYFSAYCLAFVNQLHQSKILHHLSRRWNDSTVIMLYDMRPEMVRDLLLIPGLATIIESVDFSDMLSFVKTYTKSISETVVVSWHGSKSKSMRQGSFHGRSDDDLYHIVVLSLKLFPNKKMTKKKIDELQRLDSSVISEYEIFLRRSDSNKFVAMKLIPTEAGSVAADRAESNDYPRLTAEIDVNLFYEIISKSGYYIYCHDNLVHLKRVYRNLVDEREAHRSTIEEIFDFQKKK